MKQTHHPCALSGKFRELKYVIHRIRPIIWGEMAVCGGEMAFLGTKLIL
jgi:hypothetical protein